VTSRISSNESSPNIIVGSGPVVRKTVVSTVPRTPILVALRKASWCNCATEAPTATGTIILEPFVNLTKTRMLLLKDVCPLRLEVKAVPLSIDSAGASLSGSSSLLETVYAMPIANVILYRSVFQSSGISKQDRR